MKRSPMHLRGCLFESPSNMWTLSELPVPWQTTPSQRNHQLCRLQSAKIYWAIPGSDQQQPAWWGGGREIMLDRIDIFYYYYYLFYYFFPPWPDSWTVLYTILYPQITIFRALWITFTLFTCISYLSSSLINILCVSEDMETFAENNFSVCLICGNFLRCESQGGELAIPEVCHPVSPDPLAPLRPSPLFLHGDWERAAEVACCCPGLCQTRQRWWVMMMMLRNAPKADFMLVLIIIYYHIIIINNNFDWNQGWLPFFLRWPPNLFFCFVFFNIKMYVVGWFWMILVLISVFKESIPAEVGFCHFMTCTFSQLVGGKLINQQHWMSDWQ